MLLRRFYDPKLAQASYLIACGSSGEAIVIDPNRDAAQYIRAAEGEGVRIAFVTETHIHAGFVSGSRELAAATRARVHLSGEGGPALPDGWAIGGWGEPASRERSGAGGEFHGWLRRVAGCGAAGGERRTARMTDCTGAGEALGALEKRWKFDSEPQRFSSASPALLQRA